MKVLCKNSTINETEFKGFSKILLILYFQPSYLNTKKIGQFFIAYKWYILFQIVINSYKKLLLINGIYYYT